MSGHEFWRTKLNSARLVVAPMVDMSELPWRMLCRRHKADLCYTPMLHSQVFIKDTTYQKDHMVVCEEDRPLIVQFCADDPDTFLTACKIVAPHCEAVDINLGCPQNIARRGHYGAFLMEEWDLIYKLINVSSLNANIPVTAKIRVFESIERTVEYAKMVEQAGAKIIGIHGRTLEQKGPNTGLASWDHIKAVKQHVNVPVFANGNIQYYDDIERCLKYTGVEGVMTAEGNLHNPALFEARQPFVWEMADEYLELVQQYPCPLAWSRGHMFKLFHYAFHVHIDLREKLATGKSLNDFVAVSQMVKERGLEDMRKYGDDYLTELSEGGPLRQPYWLCQPYFRPTPDEARERQLNGDERAKKRPGEAASDENGKKLSINKMKKLLRYPQKNFGQSNRATYELCECGQPKSKNCVFGSCRNCCKVKAFKAVEDCTTHRLLFKTKSSKEAPAETADATGVQVAT